MLWEVEIRPAAGQVDREGERILAECSGLGLGSVSTVTAARSFLLQGDLDEADVDRLGRKLLVDGVAETFTVTRVHAGSGEADGNANLLNVLFKPGVTDNVAGSTLKTLKDQNVPVEAVATCRKYWLNEDADKAEVGRLSSRVLSNDAIEHVVSGPLKMDGISVGSSYEFKLTHVAIRIMNDKSLERLSVKGQLYLSLEEMRTIKQHFIELERDPTDVELETVAQTWSEHCSHKTLAGRIAYEDENGPRQYKNMLKETIFAATVKIREQLGEDDWCVSVFVDNAGVIKFDEKQDVCFKVETHNHPSALEPYGGANTGIGGVIRDPMGTGLGARPVCNTDVFCFGPPDYPHDKLPKGTLHPKTVARGVVSGVRDYGNRMGIPTVNGAVYFDERYLGNPLVYCGNVAMLPVGKSEKQSAHPGDLIVAVGGRTGRDGIHGATFSSAELTEESEELSGGAVQIGNAITEKIVMDVILQARDQELFRAITDCGAGGFSSAVGEMGEDTGAVVWLEKCPLKYSGLSYTEIWISEAQERMVLAVPPEHWDKFKALCDSEEVEAAVIGEFNDDKRLVLKYDDQVVADVTMAFLHDGRPPVVRQASYQPAPVKPLELPQKDDYTDDLKAILGSLNVCSKEWVIRQYDHEVQGGSVVKPLVGVHRDGPSDAAVVRPDLESNRGLVISCGMNPHFGDLDPYWMAASAIDEAVRNCVATGADPSRIAILDNFCWGNCERPETLGSLVRAAIACQDLAVAYGTPFISGKDSLNNEFSYEDENGERQTVVIPSTLLISALGQIANIENAVTMDLKSAGNRLILIGETKDELGGSHFSLVNKLKGGSVPTVDSERAPKIFAALHDAISSGLIESCHDLSEGGLAAAAAEMAFAGDLGATLNLSALATSTGLSDAALLFSESNTRFLIEVAPENAAAVSAKFGAGLTTDLGEVTDSRSVVVTGSSGAIIDEDIDVLRTTWKAPLNW
ncbi:MAG: phosphoribosylformylglycinamidine synthase subunit PurL [Planctomycetota bacterium]|nr:phosphoribosylformylglycinamidine synthase subunit PurL [Planctomycetota bacterium]MDA1248869.1 phosphoribosylformylglycinamidine synthase subunit PurL [Planctomycetota bacterium]